MGIFAIIPSNDVKGLEALDALTGVRVVPPDLRWSQKCWKSVYWTFNSLTFEKQTMLFLRHALLFSFLLDRHCSTTWLCVWQVSCFSVIPCCSLPFALHADLHCGVVGCANIVCYILSVSEFLGVRCVGSVWSLRSCEICSKLCGLRRIGVVQKRSGSVIWKDLCVCGRKVWSVSDIVIEIQYWMVILNVGMMKRVELKIVILILGVIWSIGLTVCDMIFGIIPSVYVSLVELGIRLGRMI